jgi:Na+/phosphate symporter
MGLKIDKSPVDAQLSKMVAAIENIASLVAVGNLVVNQLMEREAATPITAKAASTKEPKWTTVMAKNVRQVVSWAMETLANTLKQEERKFNLRLMDFKAKEGEIRKELVQQLNTKLLQGQMKIRVKVIAPTWQQLVVTYTSTPVVGVHPGTMLLKFMMNEDHQPHYEGTRA